MMVFGTTVFVVAGEFLGETPPTTTTTTTIPDGGAGANSALGLAVLGAALLVVVAGLIFALIYHSRLLKTVDKAIDAGQRIGTKSEPAHDGVGAQAAPGEIGVDGPAEVESGASATFTAVGYATATAVSWTVDGGGAEPSEGDGREINVKFGSAGTAIVTASESGRQSKPLNVSVKDPPKKLPEGIVLPFAVANWGRLLVVCLGVGIVGALMVWDVISAAAGMGPLGALLGVGAASATAEKTAEPKNDDK